ncbi:hypothetical protein K525DRAFT_275145 [Schizophyllum commune Loenen D]|nr:hypothetical protein K525DRAFT_275145 [Schizophyllum commune Loenen D]
MTNDLANLRRDFAAVNQALQQAEVQAKSAKDALLCAQGARNEAEARLVDAEKRAALAEARGRAEKSVASAQKRAVVAEERERSALVKLTAVTADVATANARAEDAEKQRIINAAHVKAELEASQAAAMYEEARKDRDIMAAECVRLRRELDAQSLFISSIKAQVASLPGCLDQQANREVSTPPLAHAPPNRLPAAALDANSSTEASLGIAMSRTATRMPVTVQGSIDPGEDNMPPGIQYNEQGQRICGWCKEDQVDKKNPRWCPSGLGSGPICQKCWKKARAENNGNA